MIKAPALLPCPSCGLAVQRGTSPYKLAWHDCATVIGLRQQAVPQTPESIEAAVLSAIAKKVQTEDLALRELTALLELLRGGAGSTVPKEERGISEVLREMLTDAQAG